MKKEMFNLSLFNRDPPPPPEEDANANPPPVPENKELDKDEVSRSLYVLYMSVTNIIV